MGGEGRGGEIYRFRHHHRRTSSSSTNIIIDEHHHHHHHHNQYMANEGVYTCFVLFCFFGMFLASETRDGNGVDWKRKWSGNGMEWSGLEKAKRTKVKNGRMNGL